MVPPAPLVDAPLRNEMSPTVPPAEVPVLRPMSPLTPILPELAEDTSTGPLERSRL